MKTILVDAYNTFVTNEGINLDMQKILDKFENRKIILTNADNEKQKKLGLVNLPYELFTLSFNPVKSNSEYYKTFLEKYDLKASDVIYFEHNLDAVKSAESLGIKTYYYDKNKKDLSSLEKFLKENI